MHRLFGISTLHDPYFWLSEVALFLLGWFTPAILRDRRRRKYGVH